MLGRFCDVEIIEVADENLDRVKSQKQLSEAKQTEAKRILEKISGFVVACDLRGRKFTSETFSGELDARMQSGASTITFVIGGSAGLAQSVLDRADLALCVSDMTLPHRLFRIVLLEQVYRAFKIMRGETYHK